VLVVVVSCGRIGLVVVVVPVELFEVVVVPVVGPVVGPVAVPVGRHELVVFFVVPMSPHELVASVVPG